MFTGIIEYLGVLAKKEAALLTFKAPLGACKKLHQGTSIAINGVCVTVFKKSADTFSTEVIPQTLKSTMLDHLKKDDLVNLELPVTPQSLLSGHLVQGHVDGVGTLIRLRKDLNSHILTISFPEELGKYTVDKGSIAVNGISLTVIKAGPQYFTVGIIPYTFRNSMLHTLNIGDLVNIEVDILAKYTEKLLK